MVACIIIEGASTGLYTIWFALGAMLATICAAVGFSFHIQLAVFILASVLLLLFLRPLVKNYFNVKKSATNVDRVMEKTGIVTEDIDNTLGHGAIYIDGKTWTARSYDGDPISKDTHVSVKLIEGVKLIVAPIIAAPMPDAAIVTSVLSAPIEAIPRNEVPIEASPCDTISMSCDMSSCD
jgi:membrane protein implicated in regulation of membrane protease activity